MFSFSSRLIYALSNKIFKKGRDNDPEKNLTVDFSRTKKSPFDIKAESSYNSYLSNPPNGPVCLTLGIKKTNCIAWTEIPELEYRDHVIEARMSLDSLGGYASAGIIFRVMDDESYYLALVSSKGYFRLDVVKDNAPKTLIAWTEISDFDAANIKINIITYGTFLILIINDKWAGETNDDTISRGRLGFALASYEENSEADETDEPDTKEYTCKAWLEYISVNAQIKHVEGQYKKWTNDLNINAEGRLRLAETFAAMGEYTKALDQINRAWKRRSEAIKTVTATDTDVRTKKELLLAARMSFGLENYNEAEEYIDLLLDQWASTAEGKLAYAEKIKVLNELNKFKELKDFVKKNSDKLEKDINYYTLLARCHFELKEYAKSASAWESAFKKDSANGIFAANAANALESAGKNEQALAMYLEAGKIFLKQDNMPELAVLMAKLSVIGDKNWEARVLAGKWLFSIEDYDRCEIEFAQANKLRNAIKPRPDADPAHYYLWGLVQNIKGRNAEAVRLLEKAVKLAPDYGLFRFKLAEFKLLNGVKNKNLAEDLKSALNDIGDDPDGSMAVYAANLLQKAGDAKNAKYFLNLAKKKET